MDAKALPLLAKQVRELGNPHSAIRKQMLAAIGGEIAKLVDPTFGNQASPAGTPWAPAKEAQDHPLLENTLTMRNGFRYEVGDNQVHVTNVAPYTGYHQTGTKYLPARPMLPVDEGGMRASGLGHKIQERTETLIKGFLPK